MSVDTKSIVISQYDQNQLRNLGMEIVHNIQEFGSSGSYVDYALQEAFRLGFTAVARGEAETQRHPWPEHEDGDSEDRFTGLAERLFPQFAEADEAVKMKLRGIVKAVLFLSEKPREEIQSAVDEFNGWL